MALSAERLTRLRARTAHDLAMAQRRAAKNVRALAEGTDPDSDQKWNDLSGRSRASLILAQATMAAERAQTLSQVPKQLGVVVVHARLEDTPANRLSWEEQAASLNQSRAQAIEAVAVVKEPDAS